MQKDIKIDGRMQRVFVLTENDKRICYIPLKSLHRVDYEQLKDLSHKYKSRMMEGMAETTLQNGRNALRQYDKIIQVANKGEAPTRLKKPEEAIITGAVTKEAPVVEMVSKEPSSKEPQALKVRRKPTPRPKAQASE